ncbi:MAG: hypothetical protein KAQ96_13695, partial [Thermoplasmata archaeon]|nr:hypothetical protein [Thermoplasmata archaeon]
EVIINVTQSGSYTVKCDLTVEVSGNTVHIDTVLETPMLEEDVSNKVDLVFPSQPIYDTEVSGVYQADIEVQKYDYAGKWKVTHYTKFYDHHMFDSPNNPPVDPPEAPGFEEDEDYIKVTTSAFQVLVNRTSPQVIYGYLHPRPDMPDFMVIYDRLIFFHDDGDRIYEGETPVASVLLGNYPWVFGNIVVSGPKITFDLKALVSIPQGPDLVSATLWLTFTVSNGTVLDPENSPWIRGDAAELKVDFRMDIEAPVEGANHVSLQSSVTDTLGNTDFMVEDPVGYHLYPRTEETSYLAVPRMPGTQSTVVGQVSGNLVWLAYQGWMNTADETLRNETTEFQVDVRGSFRIKGGQMELYIAYPYVEDLWILYHDPSMGVIQENLPQQPPPPGPGDEPEPNIFVFFFALIVGAVILILTVYARAQGY